MIRTPGVGIAFSEGADGDMRDDESARRILSAALGVSSEWATVQQVHGNVVIKVEESGKHGPADGLWTATRGLPVAVLTADCYGVAVMADGAVGVAHAGWRGARAGVVGALLSSMSKAGHDPRSVHVGPGIGGCCFEVGDDVAEHFGGYVTATTWGTRAVDLLAAVKAQVHVPVEAVDRCTHHEHGFFSHRRNGTDQRLATLAWL